VIGRIGVAVSGADSNRIYALVENERGGLYVSDNAGSTWTLVNENRNVRQRAFYYTHVIADPVAKDTVYMLNTSAFRSTDGGKTLTNVGAGTHGDHHDLWIDPDDPKHLVNGNDGGGTVSMAGGQGWSAQDVPTAQYYHVISTSHVPYHECGAQQGGATVCVPSNTNLGGGGRGGGGGSRGGVPGSTAPAARSQATSRPIRGTDIFYAGGNDGSFTSASIAAPATCARSQSVSARVLRRAVQARSSSAGSGPIRSSSRRSIPPCSTPRRSTLAHEERRRQLGRDQPDLSAPRSKTMGDSGGPITTT
jgi:hypothetical protein